MGRYGGGRSDRQYLGEDPRRPFRVGETDVQRGEAEAQDVRTAQVADHTPLGERAHHRLRLVRVLAPQRDLAAALLVGGRGDGDDPALGNVGGDALQEEVRERQRLGPHRIDRHTVPDVQRRLQGQHGQDVRGADASPYGTLRGGVSGGHRERVGVRGPPGQGRVERRLMALGDVQVGGRAGAAVEVLVRTADGEVHTVRVEAHRQGARAVAQVPDGERTRLVDGGGETGQVVEPARTEVDVVQEHDRRTGAERTPHLGRVDGDDTVARHPGRRTGDVPVRGERRGVDQDLVPALVGEAARGHHGLEDVHTGGVAHHDLSGGRADQRGDPVADPLGRGPPAALVPGADAQRAPLTGDDVLHTGGNVTGQRAQRVAVEVDGVVEREQLA